jgi:cytochrome c biogenesis protein CcmG/thiol:disulfide interchange protein DsbE
VTKPRRSNRWLPVAAALLALAALASLAVIESGRRSSPSPLAFTPALDPGTPVAGQAPGFTLTDQFGGRVSLRSFRGRVVILAFNDSQCTTICPLTTTAMVGAKRLLGADAPRVALLGIDANPSATSVLDVRSYSEAHGMTHAWRFLTGSLLQLKRVWSAYHIAVAVQRGQIDHTPALFVIDPAGDLAKVYLTQMSYGSIGQQSQLLAQEASGLLRGHPRVASHLAYAQIPPITPATRATLPRADGGTVALGAGTGPHLLVFFATWDSQVMNLAAQLEALRHYAAGAAANRLPGLTAVDEASVEPSASALPRFLRGLPAPLSYPVGIDRSGRIADGYGVQDEPWLVLVSADGSILWYYDVSTSGWLSTAALARQIRAAIARAGRAPSATATRAMLAGSPQALVAIHRQAGQLLGGLASLSSRLRALRGYPVVVNVWASWCAPCRSEFGLLASASARYGREVGFLGIDASDSVGDARAFLAGHHVSYPSYASSIAALGSLAVIVGLPTTIFIDPAGKVVFVHTGQYDAEGTLDADISRYALRPGGAPSGGKL